MATLAPEAELGLTSGELKTLQQRNPEARLSEDTRPKSMRSIHRRLATKQMLT